MFRFLMLEGVWIIVGTTKIFAEQNGDRGVEILDSAPFDASHGLLPCYNRSGAAVFPLGLTASGKYLTAPDRFPRADWQHKFLVTGLNPLNKQHPGVRNRIQEKALHRRNIYDIWDMIFMCISRIWHTWEWITEFQCHYLLCNEMPCVWNLNVSKFIYLFTFVLL